MLALTLAVPAFALEESDVEAAVSSSSREAVTGNVLVWFLCAVGFLKVSQKIDSFMASIGVNVGHTGGSMLGEAMVAFKGVSLAAGMAGKVVGNFADRASSRAGGAASGSSGFLQGGLAGVVSRKITNDAVRTATQTTQKAASSTMSAAHQATERTVNAERQASSVVHQAKQTRSESASQKSQTGVTHQQVASSTRTASVSSLRRESQHSVGLGGRIFTNSMLEGGRFANDVIGMVAAGDLHSTGSITGEFASQALSSYMGITAQGDAAPQISYLKIAPVKVQFKALTKRADINRHLDTVRRELEHEQDPRCRVLQEDYLKLIRQLGSREAITRRFFLVFEYEPLPGTKRGHEEEDAIASLQTAARTAANYLRQCGNEVISPENEDDATAEILYNILCRRASSEPFYQRIKSVLADYMASGRDINAIPVNEFYAPDSIDLTHGNYLCVDGLYYAYLLVPSDGYKARVPAGWLSLLVNAGDGIDLDVFLARQPKDRMARKLGQQLRINRSKIKETSDTNTDFDDLDGAIRSGYFLKDGLSNNEDFYYLNLLITVTAGSVDDLEWKVAEMKKLLLSQDMDVQTCSFCQEQAFLSSLPLVSLERQLYERSKRNVLTTGAASCYPFTSYEMCDDNGILLGVNKHNNSLIIVDIFDSRVYKNANIAILGTSGAGKTFTLQLMALRMRRKGIQVFIIAPLKGHEFHRACSNIGGQFISISPASQNCINIMEIRKADKSVDDLLDGPGAEKSLLAAKIQRLHTFFSLLIPDMSHEERQLLDDAMICTYGTKGITHDNASLEQPENPGCYKEMPILGDLYEILAASPETKRLANILNRLVNGSARSFNQQTNVALDNKYIVLDISELTGHLLTA